MNKLDIEISKELLKIKKATEIKLSHNYYGDTINILFTLMDGSIEKYELCYKDMDVDTSIQHMPIRYAKYIISKMRKIE